MKTTVVLAALAASFAGMTSAQSLSDIPACVLTCTTQAASSAGCSGITDVTCVCTNTAFLSAVSTSTIINNETKPTTPLQQSCLASSCTASDQQAALSLQSALCGASAATSGVTSAIASSIASAASGSTTNVDSLTSAIATESSAAISSAVSSASSAQQGVSSAVSSARASASSAASSAIASASAAVSNAVSSAASRASSAASGAASGASRASSAAASATSAPASGALGSFDMSGLKVAGLVGAAVMAGMMVIA